MRILVYGAGAVGGYLGGHLALGGHTVTLLGRPPLVNAVSRGGLTLHLAGGTRHIHAIRAVSTLRETLDEDGPYDWIAFTMKAYGTVAAILELREVFQQQEVPPIACFQNGVGNEESLIAVFGADRVVAGALTTPVSVLAPGGIVEEKRRGVALASDSPAFDLIRAALRDTSLAMGVVSNTDTLKWSKLLLNMIGNATAAILDMSPGDIFRDPRLFAVEWEALREALAVMQLMRIGVANLPGTPVRLLASAIRRMPPALLRPALLRQIASGRGQKMPSLQAALRAGERRTEVTWLNGAVALAADRIGRLAPVNHVLALVVADIAAGRIPWEMYRHKSDLLLAAVRSAKGMSQI